MGTSVGRIEKEFVFKALVDDGTPCDVHGTGREAQCRFSRITDERLEMVPAEGKLPSFQVGEEIRVFFYLKNNYHTFSVAARYRAPLPCRSLSRQPIVATCGSVNTTLSSIESSEGPQPLEARAVARGELRLLDGDVDDLAGPQQSPAA